jgi:flagellin-like protein
MTIASKRFYEMRKGITPVIAIIVLLLITVALAGATWTYLSAYWEGIVGKNVQVMDSYCVAGSNGIILVRNTGTQMIGTGEMTVINTTDGKIPTGGSWLDLNGTIVKRVNPGVVVKYNMSCKGLCLFRFLVGGRTMTASVQC